MDHNVKTYVKSVFLKQELLYFRTAYDKPSRGCFDFFTRLNPHLVALNNFKDFADNSSIYLKDEPELQDIRKSLTPKLECVKYIRHRICGHIDDCFVEQAIKWTPQILINPSTLKEGEKNLAIAEMFAKSIIESALNSYQVDFPKQTIFHNEIDIMYPPNFKELMCFIEDANEDAINFLELLSKNLRNNIHFYADLKEAIPALMEAGEMEFGTKNRK